MEDLRRQRQTTLRLFRYLSLDENLDSITAHIEYVQENILELENDLIAVDDTKVGGASGWAW